MSARRRRPWYRRLKYKNIVVALMAMIFIILVIVAACQAGGDDKGDDKSSKEDSSSVEDTSSTTEPSVIIATDYTPVEVSNDKIYEGNLILVNNDTKYNSTPANLVNVYNSKTSSFKAKDMLVELDGTLMQALNSMLDEFARQTGVTNVMIISGYRSVEYQQQLYDEELASTGQTSSTLVTIPGYSEHHTGMATDFGLYPTDGVYRQYDGEGDYAWIEENCHKYGIILRYPEGKLDITGIDNEPWHFRYVGKPHSTYIMSNGICLEEYIELLREYTLNTQPLYVTADDGDRYAIYYVAASENTADNITAIPIPRYADETVYEYSISGNNIDGFIVTVKL